jgi:Uma2 family endonuclease
MSQTAVDPPRRHRLSVADYYRMAEVGILAPDARVELIDGEIIDMAPIGSLHNATVDQLAELLKGAAGDAVIVRAQGSISLGAFSEPEPDIALLRRRADFYRAAQPGAADVLLIVEVAVSSLPYDRDVKVPLYARHGIPEVWLIDIEALRLTRYRAPKEGMYTLVEQPDLETPISLDALPDACVTLRPLFAHVKSVAPSESTASATQ